MTGSALHRTSESLAALVVLAAAVASCGDSAIPGAPGSAESARAPSATITACPEGAALEGDAPPRALRQRCLRPGNERHGASRDWYEGGGERSYSEWWEGAKHGRFMLWFKNGRVRSEGAHRHGVPAGHWTYYREDGTVQQQRTFDVSPPSADWLTEALAGHPPPHAEPGAASGASGDPGGEPSEASP